MSKLVELELLAQRVWMRFDGQQMHHAVLTISLKQYIKYILYDRNIVIIAFTRVHIPENVWADYLTPIYTATHVAKYFATYEM